MEETKYFVDFATHNAKSGGWNYKQTKMFTDLSSAKKEFHNVLSTYIQYGDLDHVVAIIWDMYGNKVDSEFWQKPVEQAEE